MKKLHLTQDELLEYGKARELFGSVSPLLEMLGYTGDQLPEVLWDCTDTLAECLQEVKEKTLDYLRSKDKLVLSHVESENESNESHEFPF